MSKFVIICNTPRSGSTLAASLLVDSGACTGGYEYFESRYTTENEILPRLLPGSAPLTLENVKADVSGYVDRIKQTWGTTDKPLCVKIQWYQVAEWRQYGLDLQRHFPSARYVACTRTNLASQGISLVRALQSEAWNSRSQLEGGTTPKFGFWRVMHEMNRLAQEEESWEGYFRDQCIEPYRLRYEDLDADYRAQIVKLLEWLGEKVGPLRRRRIRARLFKQRDEVSREWEHRFYRDLIHWHTEWEKLPLEERRRIWGREPG